MDLILLKYDQIKYIYLPVPVIFGPMDFIGSASVPYPNFEIMFLVQAVLKRFTYRV